MVCPGLIPREGTTYAKCLSNKLTSYVVAYMNAITAILRLVTMIFHPSSLGQMFENMNRTSVTFVVLLITVDVIFAVILLIGLHKNRRPLITSFLIYCGVTILWMTIAIIIILFTNPSSLGFLGFVLNIFSIMLQIGFFCVIKYYSAATFK